MKFKDYPIAQFGSKWFVRWKGNNKTPNFYLQEAKNIRIINQWITVRNWYETLYEDSDGTPARAIAGNQWLFVCQDSKFKAYWDIITFSASLVTWNTINLKVNGTPMTAVVFATDELTTLWLIATQLKTQFPTLINWTAVNSTLHTVSIVIKDINTAVAITNIVVTWGASQPTGTSTENTFVSLWSIWTDVKCNIITRWPYTIILTWVWFPWYYDGTTLTQTSNSNIPAWANPYIWSTFAWFTCVAWNSAADNNIVYISKPIWPTTAINCVDWSDNTQRLTMKSPIQGMIWTLFNLWIFTNDTIEYISRNNLSNVGGVASLFSLPLWQWSQLSSHDSVVGAGDKIFYLTRDKKIRSIGFKPGIVDPQLWDLSDVPLTGIDWYMNDLADNQSQSHMIFDRTRNLVKIWVRWVNSAVPDQVPIYDLINDTRLEDDNKLWSDICEFNNNYYAIWCFDFLVLHEESGKTDIDQPIDWLATCTTLWFWAPSDQKIFWWMQFAGTITSFTNIYCDVIVDNNIKFTWVLKWSQRVWISSLGIWSTSIWGSPIGWSPWKPIDLLWSFDVIINSWYILFRGKRIWVRFRANDSLDPDFLIDFLSFRVAGLRDSYEQSDMQMNAW